MKKILFGSFIALFGYTTDIVAQATSSQPFSSSYEVQKIPANPDVAQLGRFGDVPVNKYNGTANISVPIYEIDFDGLKIPIALKYNTGGVRVEQEASWVGLGWSLSDGMTITREVNGYEDIYNYDHLNAESIGWIFSKDYLVPVYPDDLVTGELSEKDLRELQDKWYLDKRPADTEPDHFTVNLPSGSCKFMLPKKVGSETMLGGKVLDNMNFTVVYDLVNYTFKITDPNGFVYDFTVAEHSTGYGSYESTDNYKKTGVVAGILFPIFHGRHMISSWRVSKITSPRGRELNFEYENGFYFSYPHFSESHDILTWNQATLNLTNGSQTVAAPVPMSANMTAFQTKNLSLISGDFGTVDFVLSDRQDLVSKQDKNALSGYNPSTAWNTYLVYGEYNDILVAKKVDQVVVRNKANEIIKTANLSYSYFNSQWVGVEPDWHQPNPSLPGYVDPFQCDISYIRLKLDRVDIGDQKYQFEYHQPNALPAKYSRSVDFWGFYNGIDNYTKIPSFNRFYVNHPGGTGNLHDEWYEFFIKITGGNRSADINFGKIGNLQKITYPTGGYTTLDYEANKVTMSNVTYKAKQLLSNGSLQLRFTDLDSSSNYKYSYQYMKLAKTPAYSLYDNNAGSFCDRTVATPVESQFTMNGSGECGREVKITVTFSCSSSSCSPTSPSGRAVWLVNTANGGETTIFDYSQVFDKPFGEPLETTRSLADGTYILRSTSWFQSSTSTALNALGKIYIPHPVVPNIVIQDEEFEVGGARVKSVSNFDYDGSFISKSNYLYDQFVVENGKQVSNGKLMDELIFHSKAQNLFDYTALDFLQNTQGCGAVLSSDIKIRTNPSASGSHIGYSLVREERVDANEAKLGQTVTEFSNKPNEYILKPSESLPKIIFGSNYDLYHDFHSYMDEIDELGFGYYPVFYGTTYILSTRPVTYDFSNGSVVSEKIYDLSNNLIQQTNNAYTTFVVWNNTGGIGSATGSATIPYYIVNGIIHFQPYRKIELSETKLNLMQQLVATTSAEFRNGIQLTNTTNNYFENPAHFLMTKSTSTSSDGALYTTKYYYPKDLSTVPFMSNLVSKNEVTTPIISERYKGTAANPLTTLLEKAQTFYSNSNSITNDVLPSEVYTYNMGDATGQQRVHYEKYSNYGTLIQYRKSNENFSTSLLWGNYKTNPIAQIVNAKSDQVAFDSFEDNSSDGGWTGTVATSPVSKTGMRSLETGNTISKSGLPTGNYVVGFWARLISGGSGTVTVNGVAINITDSNWKYYEVTKSAITSVSLSNSNVYVDELRLYPVGAQMTSYTYKPLIGITSQTDPNGKVTTFEYDSQGRLVLVKDNDGNIVKKYSYNYKQNTSGQ